MSSLACTPSHDVTRALVAVAPLGVRAKDLQKSAQLAMPTSHELRSLPAVVPKTSDMLDEVDRDTWRMLTHRVLAQKISPCASAGVEINPFGDMVVGTDANNNSVWACLVSAPAGYRCDAPQRAYVQIVVVKSGEPLVEGLQSLDGVTDWHQAIQGSDLAGRYAFVYDVLVEDAQFLEALDG